MPTLHLICGPVGSGKTTYALKLAQKARAVHFPIDDWMSTLFSKDAPNPLELPWALERTERCETQIWKVAQQILALGNDVIFDLGFFKREHRDRFRRKASELGIPFQFHFTTADREVRRERVRIRNQNAAEALSIEISDSIFNWAESWFEEPAEAELADAQVIKTDHPMSR